jgi:L-rhamnose isomerase
LAASGFTLSSADTGIQKFWIEHCQASRKIGAHFGRALGTPAITNIWIPDGYKDTPVDRKGPRERLVAALDAVLAEKLDPRFNLDAVEGKLFGLGSESYVVGSHEFYLAYALSRKVLLCLDAGHFHPTETIADKISSVLLYLPEILLHVSRGVRWDSDHVVVLTDDLNAIMQEIIRGDFARRVHIGLDYFDASINRVAAWVIGSRAALRALLSALLEPAELCALEQAADFTGRLATLEEAKGLPAGAVWDYYCLQQGVPVGVGFLDEIRAYERTVQSKRG